MKTTQPVDTHDAENIVVLIVINFPGLASIFSLPIELRDFYLLQPRFKINHSVLEILIFYMACHIVPNFCLFPFNSFQYCLPFQDIGRLICLPIVFYSVHFN